MYPVKFTPEEQLLAYEQLKAAREKSQAAMTDNDKVVSNLMSFKFLPKD